MFHLEGEVALLAAAGGRFGGWVGPSLLRAAECPRTLKAIRRCPLPLAALPPAGHSNRSIRRSARRLSRATQESSHGWLRMRGRALGQLGGAPPTPLRPACCCSTAKCGSPLKLPRCHCSWPRVASKSASSGVDRITIYSSNARVMTMRCTARPNDPENMLVMIFLPLPSLANISVPDCGIRHPMHI